MRGAADKHTCKLPAFTAAAGGCIPTALTGGLSPFPSRVCWRPNNLKDRPFPAGRCRSFLPNPVTFLARAARQEDGYTRSGPLLGVGIPPAMEVSSEPLSADVMIIKKEAELQCIWEDLALEASGRATLGEQLEKPDWSAAEEAQLKSLWMSSWAQETSLQENKTYVMDVLRGLRRVVDVDEYAANLPLAAAMMKRRTLSNVINKKEKQLEVVRGNLKATSKELADARQKLQQLPPRADRAHRQHIVDATFGVQESFREDKTYILAELRGLHMKFSELEAAIKRAMQLRGPSPLHAAPFDEVIRRLRRFVEPNPRKSGLLKEPMGPNLAAAAIKRLYELREDARTTGFVTGSPGRGKTLFLLLLLLSVDPENVHPVELLSKDMQAWWTTLPIFVITFNGVCSVSIEDHVLAWLNPSLPLLLRIIYSESWDPTVVGASFSSFRSDALERLKTKKMTVADVEAIANDLAEGRLAVSTTEHHRGILLVDELPRLSLSALSPSELNQLERDIEQLSNPKVNAGAPDEEPEVTAAADEAAPATAATAATTAAKTKSTTAQRLSSTAIEEETAGSVNSALTAEAATQQSGAPTERLKAIDSSQPEDGVMKTAEAVRKKAADWCETRGVRPVMTAFNERFIDRQAGKLTGSLSNVWELVRIPLLPRKELIAAHKRRLVEQGFALRRTTATGQRRLQSSDVTAKHFELLTLGHPRACVVLDVAIEGSRDGDSFLGILLFALDPSRLSVAKVSIEILAQYPLLMAAGLLNIDLPSTGFFTETLSFDSAFGEGALLARERLGERGRSPAPMETRTKKTTIIVTFFLAAIALEEELAIRRSSSAVAAVPIVPATPSSTADTTTEADEGGDTMTTNAFEDIVVATVHNLSDYDGGVYSACREVRRALLNGDVPVAWENFFIWSEVLASRNRALLMKHEALLRSTRRLPYRRFSVRMLYPAPDRLTGKAHWLEAARMDAAIPRLGVVHFSTIPELLQLPDDVKLGHVWRPWSATFTGIDGIMFMRCTAGARGGPRKNELAAIVLECKSAALVASADIQPSCSALREQFGDELWQHWQRRTALVFVSREKAPTKLDMRTSSFAIDSAIVVDIDSLEKAYGTAIATFAFCADSLFGSQVVRTSSTKKSRGGEGGATPRM